MKLSLSVCISALAFIASNEVMAIKSFGEFVQRFEKEYSSHKEFFYREAVFEQSLKEIKLINSKNLTWSAGVNEYSDLTWEEFSDRFLMSEPQDCSATNPNTTHKIMGGDVQKVDWRDKNVVSHVKNQGSCGSCWTFSTTGAVESANAIVNNKTVLLAEQQLIDCAGGFNNFGCEGGLPSQAFQYIMWAGGIETEDTYPYTATDDKCAFNKKNVAVTLKNEVNITEGSENELVDALTNVGPVSVAYQVADDFRHYTSGVYDSTTCKSGPQDVNHAVLAVGFDKTDDLGEPYYIIKNSWGTSFGIDGYFNMVMGKNMCGISTCASYPIAEKMAETE